jgi:hypothetical protein
VIEHLRLEILEARADVEEGLAEPELVMIRPSTSQIPIRDTEPSSNQGWV